MLIAHALIISSAPIRKFPLCHLQSDTHEPRQVRPLRMRLSVSCLRRSCTCIWRERWNPQPCWNFASTWRFGHSCRDRSSVSIYRFPQLPDGFQRSERPPARTRRLRTGHLPPDAELERREVCCMRKFTWRWEFASIVSRISRRSLKALERGRARGARDFGVSLLWIFDATRHFGVEEAQKVFELAVRYQDRHVVGIGIGGDEIKAPPELFRGVYTYAGRSRTAPDRPRWRNRVRRNPSGERSIFMRSGLGTDLAPARILIWWRNWPTGRFPVEICITSNLRTGVCKSAAEHPVKSYFDQGMMVTSEHRRSRPCSELRWRASTSWPSRLSASPTSTCGSWRGILLKPHSCLPRKNWNC